MSTIALNRAPSFIPQGQIACIQGQLHLGFENQTVKGYLIKPSGEVKSVTVEDVPKGITSENIQAFLNQSYVKLSALGESDTLSARIYTRGLGGGKVEALKAELDAKGKDKKAVFISYQWDHKDLAKQVERALLAEGIMVLRDELAFQQSGEDLNAFMQLINHPNLDKVIAIVSDKYLKSPNCMVEILETMKRFEWKKSLIPIVVEGALYVRGSESSYIKYWKENHDKWDSKRDKDLAMIASAQLEDFFANIRFTIQDDVNSLQKDNFKGIISRIVGDETNQPQTQTTCTKLGSLILSVAETQGKPILKTQIATLWKTLYKKDLASNRDENVQILADFQNRLDKSSEPTEKQDFEDCLEGIEDTLKPILDAALKETREYKIKGLFKETLEKADEWLKDFEDLYKKMESTTPQTPPSQTLTQSIQGNISDSKNFIQNLSGNVSGNLTLGDTTHTTIQGSQYNNTNSKIGIQGNYAKIETMNL